MNQKIYIRKQGGENIRRDGKIIRISPQVDAALEELSEQTGRSKTRIADLLLRKAIELVEIVDEE